jgi:hypothetical protein
MMTRDATKPFNGEEQKRGDYLPCALSGSGETTGTLRGAAPLGRAFPFRLGQRVSHAVGFEILGVDRGAGLLPPGLVEPAGIDAIEPEFVDEPQYNALGSGLIAGNGKGDAPGRALVR